MFTIWLKYVHSVSEQLSLSNVVLARQKYEVELGKGENRGRDKFAANTHTIFTSSEENTKRSSQKLFMTFSCLLYSTGHTAQVPENVFDRISPFHFHHFLGDYFYQHTSFCSGENWFLSSLSPGICKWHRDQSKQRKHSTTDNRHFLFDVQGEKTCSVWSTTFPEMPRCRRDTPHKEMVWSISVREEVWVHTRAKKLSPRTDCTRQLSFPCWHISQGKASVMQRKKKWHILNLIYYEVLSLHSRLNNMCMSSWPTLPLLLFSFFNSGQLYLLQVWVGVCTRPKSSSSCLSSCQGDQHMQEEGLWLPKHSISSLRNSQNRLQPRRQSKAETVLWKPSSWSSVLYILASSFTNGEGNFLKSRPSKYIARLFDQTVIFLFIPTIFYIVYIKTHLFLLILQIFRTIYLKQSTTFGNVDIAFSLKYKCTFLTITLSLDTASSWPIEGSVLD